MVRGGVRFPASVLDLILYTMNTNEKTWLVSNGKDKAVILKAASSDEARVNANVYYYGAFTNKKELNRLQVLDENSICHLERKLFKKVQFHSLGGVTTTYNGNVRTKPTQAQIDFLNRPIVYTKLTNE